MTAQEPADAKTPSRGAPRGKANVMRGKLQDLLNNTYLRVIRSLAKWALLLLFAALLGLGVSSQYVAPKIKKSVTDGNGVVVQRDSDGQPVTLYDDEKLPKGYDDELSVGAPQLIYQNQTRSQKEAGAHTGVGEDESQDLVKISTAERQRLVKVARRFIEEWETFELGESDSSYRKRIMPYSDLSRVDTLTSRKDNIQERAVARDGLTGSQLERYSPVAGNVRVLRYDRQSAYVATVGEVSYTGPALNWAGRKVRRSYALVLTKFRNGWKVSRAAAQTQGSIIE